MSNEEINIEFGVSRAIEGDGYHKSGLRQWAQSCGHMSSGETFAYNALCSTVQEELGWNKRNILLSDIASCVPAGKVPPGQETKFVSISTVRHLLKGLAEIGQITAPDGSPLKVTSKGDVPMTILVHTYPRHECDSRRNFRDSMAVSRGEDPRYGPSEVSGSAAPSKSEAATPAREAARKASIPAQASAPLAVSDEALGLAMETLPSRKPKGIRRLAERIDTSLSDGWALEKLSRMLKAKYRAEAVIDLTGFMISRLPDPGETPVAKPVKKELDIKVHDCQRCWGSGNEEDERGVYTGRKCAHPELVAAAEARRSSR